MIEINYVKLNEGAKVPSKAHETDACYDLVITSEEEVSKDVWRYGFGLALQVENMAVLPWDVKPYIMGFDRSSCWKRGMMLTNSTATIDNGYSGEIMGVYYWFDKSKPRYTIGDKAMQIRVGYSEFLKFREVEKLEERDRGDNGYGSSGK